MRRKQYWVVHRAWAPAGYSIFGRLQETGVRTYNEDVREFLSFACLDGNGLRGWDLVDEVVKDDFNAAGTNLLLHKFAVFRRIRGVEQLGRALNYSDLLVLRLLVRASTLWEIQGRTG